MIYSVKFSTFVLPNKARMKIELTSKSRISEVDFSNLPFGRNMSDHMFVCHFKNGAWQEPEIRPYGQL